MDANPAFKPTTRFTAIFPKVHGYIWIDEASGELARIEGEVTDDISVGLFLGKVYKGSHFMQARYEFRPGLRLLCLFLCLFVRLKTRFCCSLTDVRFLH